MELAASGFCHTQEHFVAGDLSLDCMIGTFSHHAVVDETSAVKIDADIPFRQAALLGCGVVTGWGSAVYAADIVLGDSVAVVGGTGLVAHLVREATGRVVVRVGQHQKGHPQLLELSTQGQLDLDELVTWTYHSTTSSRASAISAEIATYAG
ncbi:MAG: hypothetical protein AAGF73_18290 [Actinomycetota bacterium]